MPVVAENRVALRPGAVWTPGLPDVDPRDRRAPLPHSPRKTVENEAHTCTRSQLCEHRLRGSVYAATGICLDSAATCPQAPPHRPSCPQVPTCLCHLAPTSATLSACPPPHPRRCGEAAPHPPNRAHHTSRSRNRLRSSALSSPPPSMMSCGPTVSVIATAWRTRSAHRVLSRTRALSPNARCPGSGIVSASWARSWHPS